MKKLLTIVVAVAIALGLGLSAVRSMQQADPPPGAGFTDPTPDTTL